MSLFILQKRIFIATVIALTLAMMPLAAGAQTFQTPSGPANTFNTPPGPSNTFQTGQPTDCGTGKCAVSNPLNVTSFCGLLHNIFNAIVAIGIPVAVLFIIWAGFKFVFALGNPKELTKAKHNFFYVIIGISIFLGAWILATAMAATINAIGGSNLISCS